MSPPGQGSRSAAQAAERLGITVAELEALAGEGQIPGAVLDAWGWRFSPKGLEMFRARQAKQRDAAA